MWPRRLLIRKIYIKSRFHPKIHRMHVCKISGLYQGGGIKNRYNIGKPLKIPQTAKITEFFKDNGILEFLKDNDPFGIILLFVNSRFLGNNTYRLSQILFKRHSKIGLDKGFEETPRL